MNPEELLAARDLPTTYGVVSDPESHPICARHWWRTNSEIFHD